MAKQKFTILFIGWMMLITSLSLFSFSIDNDIEITFEYTDKVVHFIFHFGIVILGYLVLKETSGRSTTWKRRVFFMLLFSLCYGSIIEGLQRVMPYGRAAEIWDVLANSLGALTGGLLIQNCHSLIDRLK